MSKVNQVPIYLGHANLLLRKVECPECGKHLEPVKRVEFDMSPHVRFSENSHTFRSITETKCPVHGRWMTVVFSIYNTDSGLPLYLKDGEIQTMFSKEYLKKFGKVQLWMAQ